MLASQLMDLRAMLHTQGVIFAYSGYVTEPVLSGVGEALKQKLAIDDADTKTLRSVFAVFVEQMQNIIRYSAEKAQRLAAARCRRRSALREMRYGILTIGKEGNDYVVCAGNLVERDDVQAPACPAQPHQGDEQGRAERRSTRSSSGPNPKRGARAPASASWRSRGGPRSRSSSTSPTSTTITSSSR